MCQVASIKKFSLVELLIVIAIILILVSMLQPSLRRAIDQANQVVCANNIRQMSHALISYSDDHNRFPTPRDHPTLIAASDENEEGIFSMEGMAPYIEAYDVKNEVYKEVSIDPSADDGGDEYIEYMRDWNTTELWSRNSGSTGATPTMYAYWGGRTEGINGAEDQFAIMHADESTVLYSCQFWWDNSRKGWSYNHGAEGWSGGWDTMYYWNRPIPDGIGNTVPVFFQGINRGQLDGSVLWKSASEFNIGLMWNEPGFGNGNGNASNTGASPISHKYAGDTWFF